MKKPFKISLFIICGICTIAVLILAIIIAISFPWLAIYIGGQAEQDPPQPSITYGEFPFTLVYELNGEVITLRDTYICEYDGIEWNEGVGKHRQWKGYLKSSGSASVFLAESDGYKIYCNVGSAEYYMGDKENYYGIYPFVPNIYSNGNNALDFNIKSDYEIYAQYGIKILDWELSGPIENTFE